MNYFEHDQKVKYIDGILAKSQEWDWLIEYIENNFDTEFSIKEFSDFHAIYSEISDIFRYFNSINEYVDSELIINEHWLTSIYDLSLYYVGKKSYDELNLDNDFLRIFELLIYLAKLNNESNEQKYIIFSDILEYRNLYKLIDVTNFIREESEIINRLQSISINTENEISIFKSNVDKCFCDCTAVLKDKHSDIMFADCFSFKGIRNYKCATWQEKYLLDMLKTSYENDKLEPSIRYTNGDCFPNFKSWTSEIIDIMKKDFNNEDADFILESISYFLYKNIPSKKVLLNHANLLFDYYEHINKSDEEYKNYSCSSLEILISIFNDKNVPFDKEVVALYNKAINQINDIQKIVEIDSKYPISDKKLKIKIKEYIDKKLSNIDKIDNYIKFVDFINDKDIIFKSDNDVFQKVSDLFETIISDCEGVKGAAIFVGYLEYLLKIKNNRSVVGAEVSKEINYIRHLWSEEYFKKSIDSMQTVKGSVSIDNKSIRCNNKNIVVNPHIIAHNAIILNEDSVVSDIQTISKTPFLTLVTNIEINEDFPCVTKLIIDDRHEIDVLYKNWIENIQKKYSYKFLNDFNIDEILPQIYKHIKSNINMYFCLFSDDRKLYNKVVKENEEYLFLKYSKTPTLAHLTQLFPVLESKIREIGEWFGITPIREDLKHFRKLKEPTNILKRIISIIYDETQSLEQAADFIFIFFCMFAENGLSIRNNCIHGVAYNKNQNEINLAFKITLFCLNLIEYRLDVIKNNISKN